MFGISISQQPTYQKGEGSASLVTRRFGVLDTLWTQKVSVSFPRQSGKPVNNANVMLTHRDKSCSNAVWHPLQCSPVPATRTGRAPQYNSRGRLSIATAIAQCWDEQWDTSTGTPSSNSRRWNWFSGAGILQTEQKNKAGVRQSAVQLPSCRQPFGAATLSSGEGEKKQPPSSVLLFTDGAALMLSNPPEGGNSISFVPRISKWLKMAISTDINFIKGGVFPRALRRLGQEPAGDALHVNIYS